MIEKDEMKQGDVTNRLIFEVPQPGSDEALMESLFRRLGCKYVLDRAVGHEGLVWVLFHIAENLTLDAEALLASESDPSDTTIQCAGRWRRMSRQLFTICSAWELEAGSTKEDVAQEIAQDEIEDDRVSFERDEQGNIKLSVN